MCTRSTPSYRSVTASARALGLSALGAVHALALLLVALLSAPIRQAARFRRRGTRALTAVEVQVHLGDPACVAELETIVWKTLERAERTWAPLPVPLHRVVVGACFPAGGRADIYDDFLEAADSAAGDSSAERRRVVVSLGVREGTRDLDGWEIAGALAAQIQVLVDDHCQQHRSLSAPARTMTQATTRTVRLGANQGGETNGQGSPADTRTAYTTVATAGATTNELPAEEVPSLAELLATVQQGQPLVAAGPSSNGTHP